VECCEGSLETLFKLPSQIQEAVLSMEKLYMVNNDDGKPIILHDLWDLVDKEGKAEDFIIQNLKRSSDQIAEGKTLIYSLDVWLF
jgi:hypothetical protein